MNRKIYYNDKFMTFVDNEMQASQNQAFKFFESIKNESALDNIIEEFLDETKTNSITISNISFEKALKILKKKFYYIEAAGGFIEKNNQFLFINRHGRWDLPKGKLEKNETIEHAAIRECEEECGIQDLKIIRPLPSTFHVYSYKKGFALKQSYWFYMRTNYSKKLVPQTEENITEVKWFDKEGVETVILKDTYYTISDVTMEGLKVKESLPPGL
jgi:8-oxo-dGTP pyrophosphatase MutT (NUDIX family)